MFFVDKACTAWGAFKAYNQVVWQDYLTAIIFKLDRDTGLKFGTNLGYFCAINRHFHIFV